MQSVNVSAPFLSQHTDLMVKESSEASTDNNKESDFYQLVEKNNLDENKEISREKLSVRDQESLAIDEQSIAGTAKDELQKHHNHQKTDATESLNTSGTNKAASVDETIIANEKENTTNNEKLTESEQFISLLYNSDQTLAQVAEKTELKQGAEIGQEDTAIDEQSIAGTAKDELYKNHNRQKIDSTELSDTKSINKVPPEDEKNQAVNGDHRVNVSQSSDVDINNVTANIKSKKSNIEAIVSADIVRKDNLLVTSEHKLKAFSQDELLARTQLKNNNASVSAAKAEGTKDHSLLLDSKPTYLKNESITNQQLMSAQLDDSQQLTNKSQLTDQVNPTLAQFPRQALSKENYIADDIPHLTKGSAVNNETNSSKNKASSAVNLDNDIATELAFKDNEDVLIYAKKSTVNSLEDLPLKPGNSGVEKSQANKTNANNVLLEKNSPIISANTVQDQIMAVQDNQTVITNEKSAQLQQVQSHKNVVPASSEQQTVEHASEEAIESMLFAAEPPIKQDLKTSSQIIGNSTSQAIPEVQAQTVQATQVKQSNDAYFEYQVADVLNHNMISDTVQIQKINVQLQQETLSMYRKDFADVVKDKIMITINQKLQQFDITLDPPEFGNMQVRVNLQGEQASVNFVVQNQQAKESLEQNMHKLRDMLSEQGVDVGGTNVEQQNQQQSKHEENLQRNNGDTAALSKQLKKDEQHNAEHIISARLFDYSATGIDYYA